MKLFFKIAIFFISYYILYLATLVRRELLNLLNIRKRDSNSIFIKYLNISIINNLLGINSIKKSNRIYLSGQLSNYVTYKLSPFYLKLLYSEMPKICKIEGKPVRKQLINIKQEGTKKGGLVYITFHFSGNLDTLIYYLSQKHNEINFIYSDNFMENIARKYLKVERIKDILGLTFLKYFNPKLKINLLNINEPAIIFKIISYLKKNKTIIIFFDEFFTENKSSNSKNKYIEYKINGKNAAKIPKALFTILAKTDSTIIPIVNLRKGCIYNNIKIFPAISYNSNSNAETTLKQIYDAFLSTIRECPTKLHTEVWKLFTEYVIDDAPIYLKDEIIHLSDKYKITEKSTVNLRNNSINYLIKLKSFRIIKVDHFTVKLFRYIKKTRSVPKRIQKSKNKKSLIDRLGYLVKTGFIIKSGE